MVSPFCFCCPTKLYLLLCELLMRGLELWGTGGASLPLPLTLGRLLLDLDFWDDDSGVGGEERSSHELKVDEDLLMCGRSGASPSLLDVLPECEPSVSAVRKLALLRRRMLRWSLKKEGIAGRQRRCCSRGKAACAQMARAKVERSDGGDERNASVEELQR